MQDGHHRDPIFAKVIEQGVGESPEKNAAKRAMNLMKRERIFLSQINRFVEGDNEIVAEIV